MIFLDRVGRVMNILWPQYDREVGDMNVCSSNCRCSRTY